MAIGGTAALIANQFKEDPVAVCALNMSGKALGKAEDYKEFNEWNLKNTEKLLLSIDLTDDQKKKLDMSKTVFTRLLELNDIVVTSIGKVDPILTDCKGNKLFIKTGIEKGLESVLLDNPHAIHKNNTNDVNKGV